MGKTSGIDVAIAARTLLPNCKIVLLSGNAATEDLLATAKQMGYHFTLLAKPIHPNELMAQMRS